MPKFLVSQSVDIDISFIVEAETLEDALQYNKLDRSKIVDVDHLCWDAPYDAQVLDDNAVFNFLTPTQLEVYMRAGIL